MNDYLVKILTETLQKLYPNVQIPDITIEKPRIAEHGDAATTIALQLTKLVGKPPRNIAQEIKEALPVGGWIQEVEIAGPGFINFRFAETFLYDKLAEILGAGSEYGKGNELAGKKYQVEFVSANPTGPLTVGHGRNAVLGDTIARLYEWIGAKVDREYYFNN